MPTPTPPNLDRIICDRCKFKYTLTRDDGSAFTNPRIWNCLKLAAATNTSIFVTINSSEGPTQCELFETHTAVLPDMGRKITIHVAKRGALAPDGYRMFAGKVIFSNGTGVEVDTFSGSITLGFGKSDVEAGLVEWEYIA